MISYDLPLNQGSCLHIFISIWLEHNREPMMVPARVYHYRQVILNLEPTEPKAHHGNCYNQRDGSERVFMLNDSRHMIHAIDTLIHPYSFL